MPSRKRNLEKVERVANASTTDEPRWERGEVAAFLRELLAKAERGELPCVKPTPNEAKSEERLEFEGLVAKVANRIHHAPKPPAAGGISQSANDEATPDDEPPKELLAKLLRKVGLASDKVH